MTTSPGLARLAESAARILGHLGERMEFQRFSADKDRRRGSEEWLPQGDPVSARASVGFEVRKKEGGVREREEMIEVERGPFEALGGLTSEWRVLLDGAWIEISDVVLSDDLTVWEAKVCRG